MAQVGTEEQEDTQESLVTAVKTQQEAMVDLMSQLVRWRSWSCVKLDLLQEGQSSKGHTKEAVAGGTWIPNQSCASTVDRRAISGEVLPSLNSWEMQLLSVRGHMLKGTVSANPTHHAEGPGVEGHMPRGKDAANPTHLPTGDATPQVMVVSPLASYCTS